MTNLLGLLCGFRISVHFWKQLGPSKVPKDFYHFRSTLFLAELESPKACKSRSSEENLNFLLQVEIPNNQMKWRVSPYHPHTSLLGVKIARGKESLSSAHPKKPPRRNPKPCEHSNRKSTICKRFIGNMWWETCDSYSIAMLYFGR